MPLSGKGFPDALITKEDLKYPDMVWVELTWQKPISEAALRFVHRALQKRYKCNFPHYMRKKSMYFTNTYFFMGIREISPKEAHRH